MPAHRFWGSPAELALLFAYVKYASNKTGELYAGRTTIAKRAALSPGAVSRAQATLAARGIVSVELHGYDGRTNVVRLNFDDETVRESATGHIARRAADISTKRKRASAAALEAKRQRRTPTRSKLERVLRKRSTNPIKSTRTKVEQDTFQNSTALVPNAHLDMDQFESSTGAKLEHRTLCTGTAVNGTRERTPDLQRATRAELINGRANGAPSEQEQESLSAARAALKLDSDVRAPIATANGRRKSGEAFVGQRIHVPRAAHEKYVRVRNHIDAERELLAWYADVDAEWTSGTCAGMEPGPDMFAFWDQRYQERWPATRAHKSDTIGDIAASYVRRRRSGQL